MLTIEPTGAVLGATVRGIDLARPLREPDLGRILLALGKHGVLRFPDQHLDLGALKRFAEQFGEIQGGGNREHDPTQEYPELDILSNLKENGKWHCQVNGDPPKIEVPRGTRTAFWRQRGAASGTAAGHRQPKHLPSGRGVGLYRLT
jgi:alpha-ketoglutarate-dependent taurine dioxygenase